MTAGKTERESGCHLFRGCHSDKCTQHPLLYTKQSKHLKGRFSDIIIKCPLKCQLPRSLFAPYPSLTVVNTCHGR
jgi:hypothetical protein